MSKGRSRLAVVAVIGVMMIGGAVPALADGTVTWTGHGVTNGELNTVQCDANNTPYLHWVFTAGGNHSVTSATLHVNGNDYPMNPTGGAFHATTPWFTLATIVASVDYVGSLGNGTPNLNISHGCPPRESEWCSPGFWRANYVNWGASQWPVDPNTKYNSVISSPVASGDPSLIQVLLSPGSYFSPQNRGAGFNAVGDYLSTVSGGVYFTGTRTPDSCPLSQQA